MKYFIITVFILIAIALFIILKSITFPARIRKAEEFLQEGDISNASEIIKKILEKKKDFIPARYIRAQILIKQNQYLLAISELNGILNMPNFTKYIRELDIHYHLAHLYKETKNYLKEIEEYKMILTFNPDDLIANHRLGHALYRLRDYKKAKEHLMKAIIIDPNLKDIYLPLGISCYNISDYERAEEYLTLSLKQPGDHSDSEFYLGSIYRLKKDYDNAVIMFNNAKRSRKYLIKCLYQLGEIYSEQDMYKEAIEALEQGLNNLNEKTEESYAYRYLLAECYENENKIKEAVHHWTKIAADNPDYRSTTIKLESYREILDNSKLMTVFNASLDELQPMIVELISSLNCNIISKEKISPNEFQYKAYNIKRINDPPILIYFNRTTREITEGNIIDFHNRIAQEKCKNGIYITTSKYSIRAKSSAQSKMIEIYDSIFLSKFIEKVQSRKISK